MAADGEFEDFVAVASRRLLRLAYLLTRDAGSAEDLLQAALLKTWSAWSRIEGDPGPYVRRVLVNTYASWWRRESHREVSVVDLPEHPFKTDENARSDERDRVWRALGQLPRRQRAVVVLRYYEDLPEAEVAQLLGCSVGTVKSQASKALAKLRVDPALDPNGVH